MIRRTGTPLFTAVALLILGCGKEKVTQPPPPPSVPWIAIATTGFDVATTDTIRGTAGNYPDSAIVVLWQYVQEVKSEQWWWRWWEISASGDSTMALDARGRWSGVRRFGRFAIDSVMVVLVEPESLAATPREVRPGEVQRHALAFTRLPLERDTTRAVARW